MKQKILFGLSIIGFLIFFILNIFDYDIVINSYMAVQQLSDNIVVNTTARKFAMIGDLYNTITTCFMIFFIIGIVVNGYDIINKYINNKSNKENVND